MTRLVGLDDRGDLIRQRLTWEGIRGHELQRDVVARLVGARLVSLDDDSIEVAHESLAVAWPRLRSWLDDDVDGARIMRHLAVSAQSWDSLGRPPSELYRGVRQARTAEWAARSKPALSSREREFLDASAAQAASEERSAAVQAQRERVLNRRLRMGLALIGSLLVLALVAGGIAVSASRQARSQALAADARRLGAEALRARDADTRLLLAASAAALHADADTHASLLAALDVVPSLVRTARVPQPTMLAVHPRTGQVLVSTAYSGLHVRDPQTLAALQTYPISGAAVLTGAWDGITVAPLMMGLVGTGDPPLPAVALLDESGSLSAHLGGVPAETFTLQSLSLSPDGRWLAVELLDRTGTSGPRTAVWDLSDPSAPAAMLDLGASTGAPLVLDAGTLVHPDPDGLQVVDLPSGEVRHVVGAEDLRTRALTGTLAVSPDGGTLAVAGVGEVVLVDPRTWAPLHHIPDIRGLLDLEFSPDGRFLGVGGDQLVVWDVTGDGPVEVLRQDDAGGEIAFALGGETVYSTTFAGNLVQAWDLTGQRGFLLAKPPAAAAVPEVPRLSPDGRKVLHVFHSPQPVLRIRDVATGAVSPLVDAQQPSTTYLDSAWSPDGSAVTMSTGVEQVSVWEAGTGRLRARTRLPAGEGVSMSTFSRDGSSLLAGTTQGRLHLLDADTLDPVADALTVAPDGTQQSERPIDNLEPGPDGRILAVLAAGTFVVDPASRTVSDIDVDVFGAGWSPDGERVFVTMQDGRVGVLETATWRWVAEPTGAQPFAGWIVTYSPDGERVVTMAGGRAGLFDGRSGEFLGSVTVDDDGTAAFAADGRTVVIAENSGRVRTWDLDPSQWMGSACRMAGRTLTQEEWREYLEDRDYVAACPS